MQGEPPPVSAPANGDPTGIAGALLASSPKSECVP